jgi:hypothetical protein
MGHELTITSFFLDYTTQFDSNATTSLFCRLAALKTIGPEKMTSCARYSWRHSGNELM